MLLKANSEYVILKGGKLLRKNENTGKYELEKAYIVFFKGIIIDSHYGEQAQKETHDSIKQRYGDNTKIIELDESAVIIPGLLDLHNHYTYNMLPLWSLPDSCKGNYWDNRHEWRHAKSTEYHKEIESFYNFILKGNETTKPWGGSEKQASVLLRFYAELQALSGGTTVLQERNGITTAWDSGEKDHLLLRSTGVPTDLGFEKGQAVNSITDYFKPKISDIPAPYPPLDTADWKIIEATIYDSIKTYFQNYLDLLANPVSVIKSKTGGQLVHLAEGRAGNLLKEKGADAYSKLEFDWLKKRIREIPDYQEKVKASRLTIIHGCGIDLSDSDNIRFLTECEIGLLWSPVSNLLLYGDTPDYYNKVYKNCNVMLGSDWGPSGSKHVWDEARFAYSFLYNRVSEKADIYHNVLDMVTINPAKALGADNLGEIKNGSFADFYIVSPTRDIKEEAVTPGGVLSFTDYYTVGTIVNGNLIFGTEKFFSAIGQSGVSVSADGPGAEKRLVHVPDGLDINVDRDLEDLRRVFDAYSKLIGKTFMPNSLLSCDDKIYNERIADLLKLYE